MKTLTEKVYEQKNESKSVYTMYSFNFTPPAPEEFIFPPFPIFEEKAVKLSELIKSLEKITKKGLDVDLDNKRKIKLEYDKNKIKLEYDSGKIILEIDRTKRKDHDNQTGYENKNKY